MASDQRCAGKIVLVTGAQRGIGRAIAVRFAQAGADVALNYLDDKAAAESAAAAITALGRRATALHADIAKPEEARRLVGAAERAPGPIDVLGNNAAIFRRANPTGRLAEPEDIADVVVFLATDEARYVVGQLVHVNGGDYHG